MKFEPRQLVGMAGGAKPKAFCAACSSVQPYFCPKCRWCVGVYCEFEFVDESGAREGGWRGGRVVEALS